jgi:hypothetical protein
MSGILHHAKLRLPSEWLSSDTLCAIVDDASARPFSENVCSTPRSLNLCVFLLRSFLHCITLSSKPLNQDPLADGIVRDTL